MFSIDGYLQTFETLDLIAAEARKRGVAVQDMSTEERLAFLYTEFWGFVEHMVVHD